MIKTKVAFLEDRLLSIQSEQFKKYLKTLIGYKKAGPLKKPLLFWSCKQANRQYIIIMYEFCIPMFPNHSFSWYQLCCTNLLIAIKEIYC